MAIRPLITGLVTGCFDGLHAGHQKLLTVAANHCDRLIVYVNRDAYCKRKGPDRPHRPLLDRIDAIRTFAERLPCQTTVRVLMEDTPRSVLSIIQPDVLILGDDYRGQILPGDQYVQRVIFVPRVPGISTTQLGNPGTRLAVGQSPSPAA